MNVNSSTTGLSSPRDLSFKFLTILFFLVLDHHGHGTEKGQARKRKRAAAVKNFTETVGKHKPYTG